MHCIQIYYIFAIANTMKVGCDTILIIDTITNISIN